MSADAPRADPAEIASPGRHLVLTGMPGVGKTTVSQILAERLGRELRDSDTDIDRLVGMSGRDLAGRDGVAALHRLEAAVLLGALASPVPLVIAAAGSIIDDAICRSALARHANLVVLMPGDSTHNEVGNVDDHRRPISSTEMAALVERRTPLWNEHALATVAAAPRTLDETISEIMGVIP